MRGEDGESFASAGGQPLSGLLLSILDAAPAPVGKPKVLPWHFLTAIP